MTQDYPFKWLDEMPRNFGICCPAVRGDNTMPKTQPKCTLDPSVLQLIQELAQALQSHHLQYTMTKPTSGSYTRDMNNLKLIDQAEDFLAIARGVPQSWRIPEIF